MRQTTRCCSHKEARKKFSSTFFKRWRGAGAEPLQIPRKIRRKTAERQRQQNRARRPKDGGLAFCGRFASTGKMGRVPREGRALRFWGGGTLPRGACASILGRRDSPARGDVRRFWGGGALPRKALRCFATCFPCGFAANFYGGFILFLERKRTKKNFFLRFAPCLQNFLLFPS